MSDERKLASRVRAFFILLCLAGVTAMAWIMWGWAAGIFAFCCYYGLACLFDGVEAALLPRSKAQ